jgi:hypothetical protein
MRNTFVADGEQRLYAGRAAKCLEAARAKYAGEWAPAAWFKGLWLRCLIRRTGFDEKHTGSRPSPGTLW